MGEVNTGLEGAVVRESDIGRVDGEHGNLYYAGYHVDELVDNASYEEVLHLLLHGELPTREELDDVQETLAEHRELSDTAEELIASIAPHTNPMDLLRTLVSLQASFDDEPDDLDNLRDKALRITAAVPSIIAQAYRHRNGMNVVEPDPDLSHAENFLYMLHGEEPGDEEAAAMDAALILYAEHGMNASTFAGTVTASTLANMYSSITSAIGALQGPLHGGATETVIDMLEEVDGPDAAERWVDEKMAAHEKIPGFGHRVYRVTDPRCAHFKHHINRLMEDTDEEWVETIEAVRTAVEDRLGEKGIWPNADLYSGTLYRMLGIPPTFYTAIFAMARVGGWSAHVIEQLEDNRLIRPRIEYVGDLDLDWVPIEER